MRDYLNNWQEILAQGFSSATELLSFLELPIDAGSVLAEKQFKTRVPRGFAARMEIGNRYDPLLLQVLAIDNELQIHAEFQPDPVNELAVNPIPGLIHKYPGRVLLTLTGACAVHCRYCFRRHFPYEDNNPGRAGWQPVIDYIAKNTSISEVIFSGGDPLLVKNSVIAELISQLTLIPHLTTLRIHTRIPVVLPERIDDELLRILSHNRLNTVVVLHCNHAHELDEQVGNACKKLRQAGCHLLNQSVLLAGVNDHAPTLAALNLRLFEYGVLPYYLHLLDKVQGAVHFDVSLSQALTIFKELQAILPGYLVPRLVREESGKSQKTLVIN